MLSLLVAHSLLLFPALQTEEAPATQEPAEPSSAPSTEAAPEKPRKRPSRRPQLPANDPEAEAFLAQLVAAQRAEPELPGVSAFRMDFELRDNHPERGANTLEIQVDYASADGGSIRLTAHDATYSARVSKGLDAEGYWLRNEEGELITLEAKEYASDRRAIDETLKFCDDFLLLFDLDQLRRKAGGLTLVQDDEQIVLAGQMLRGRRDIWKFQLVVPREESLPTALILDPPAQEAASEEAEANAPENAEEAAAAPTVLHYEFGEWAPHAGRLLPSFIDEYHDRVITDDSFVRRSIDVNRFLWRDPREVRTTRDGRSAASSSGEENEENEENEEGAAVPEDGDGANGRD